MGGFGVQPRGALKEGSCLGPGGGEIAEVAGVAQGGGGRGKGKEEKARSRRGPGLLPLVLPHETMGGEGNASHKQTVV